MSPGPVSDSYKGPRDPTLGEQLTVAITERDEAREWVRRLTTERLLLHCAFCGEPYPPGTPASNHELLTAHVNVCPKHPIATLRAQLAERDRRLAKVEAAVKGCGLCDGTGEASMEHAPTDMFPCPDCTPYRAALRTP